MPTPTMKHLYRWRRTLLVATVGVEALAIWLITADVLQRLSGWPVYLRNRYSVGYLIAPDMGLSGVFGITLYSIEQHVAAWAVTLLTFAGTLWMFVRPHKGWRSSMTLREFTANEAQSAAFIAGLTTVGFAVLVMDWTQLWRVDIAPPVCAVVFAVASISWFMKLRFPKGKRDRYIHLIVITYVQFVAAGVLTIVAVPTQLYYHKNLFGFHHGSYTAMIIGAAVMLWTLVPSMVLIWYGQYYQAVTGGLCVKCMYNLEGTPGESCPECGEPIDRAIYVTERQRP